MKVLFKSVPLSVWVLFLALSVVFLLFPQIDIAVAGLFYAPEEGFFYNGSWWEQLLYYSVKPLLIALLSGAFVLWLYNRFSGRDLLHFGGRKLLYLLLVLALGPGLIVNQIFKENWGRARPAEIVQFGGEKHFTPAYVLSDQKGYSFSGGHAAGGFFLIALALLARRRRMLWMGLAVTYGGLVSVARMAAGGHFLSDVVVSFFVVYITSKMLYYLFFGRGEAEA
jgi:lipid A 4'-phosphatase